MGRSTVKAYHKTSNDEGWRFWEIFNHVHDSFNKVVPFLLHNFLKFSNVLKKFSTAECWNFWHFAYLDGVPFFTQKKILNLNSEIKFQTKVKLLSNLTRITCSLYKKFQHLTYGLRKYFLNNSFIHVNLYNHAIIFALCIQRERYFITNYIHVCNWSVWTTIK